MYVEGLGHNLFSIGQLCDKYLEVNFRSKRCVVRTEAGNELLEGSCDSNLYTINLKNLIVSKEVFFMSNASNQQPWLWLRRLSHLNFKNIVKLVLGNLVRGLPDLKYEKERLCVACEKGKMKKMTHKSKVEHNSTQALDLIHMDLCGPMRVLSRCRKKYVLVLVDDYPRYTYVRFLRIKDETTNLLITFFKTTANKLQLPVKMIM